MLHQFKALALKNSPVSAKLDATIAMNGRRRPTAPLPCFPLPLRGGLLDLAPFPSPLGDVLLGDCLPAVLGLIV